jgi:hypothetical protein
MELLLRRPDTDLAPDHARESFGVAVDPDCFVDRAQLAANEADAERDQQSCDRNPAAASLSLKPRPRPREDLRDQIQRNAQDARDNRPGPDESGSPGSVDDISRAVSTAGANASPASDRHGPAMVTTRRR